LATQDHLRVHLWVRELPARILWYAGILPASSNYAGWKPA